MQVVPCSEYRVLRNKLFTFKETEFRIKIFIVYFVYRQAELRRCTFVMQIEGESQKGKYFPLLHIVQTGYGAHPTSYPMSKAVGT
jgi:hypothetical protein